MQNLAEVRLWRQQVGALAYDPDSGISTFEYAPNWLNSGIEIAPLHMPLSSRKYQFPELAKATYYGLPAVFADALPDAFGNAVINAWLAQQGRAANSFSPVERLLYTGVRGMGALEFHPALQKNNQAEDLQLDGLIEIAQKVLNLRADWQQNLNSNDNQAMQSILQVGTSAGGARAKAIIAINKDRSIIRSGQVEHANTPDEFEYYLLKFDGVVSAYGNNETFGDPQGYGRMEYAYYLMAKDASINMMPAELLPDGERAHFMTKRFDRDGAVKHHYVSLCAMDHADYKQAGAYSYEQLFSVARQLRLHRHEAIELYRRMVFNVIARNHDDHTKNTGFLLKQGSSQWQLAPAFDIAYSYKPNSAWVNSHQMTINNKREHFTQDDLLQVANLIGNFKREAPKIIDHVKQVVSQWPHYAKQAGVFAELQKEIQKNLHVDI